MIADEERRKVAQKLREYASWDEDGELVGCTEFGESVLNLLSCGDTERECFNALADLIEPSIPADPGEAGLACVDAFIREHTEKTVDRDTPQKAADEMFGKMRHSTKEERDAYDAMLESMNVELHPVDRDALLALADEMEELGNLPVKHPGVRVLHNDDFSRELGYARRIREAVGVNDG